MKKRMVRTLSAFLSVLMLVSCFCMFDFSASAATYRNGAQSGPSSSYAGSRYYRNYKRVPITGDNRTDLIAIALSQLGYQEGAANGYFSGEVSGGSNYVEMSYNMGDLGLGYGGSDYPWCASFVSWCLYQSHCTDHATYSSLARNHSGDYRYIWKEISCAMWVNQLKGAGYFSYSAGMGGSYTPKYGDLVFFKSSSSPSHIGICLYVKDGVLYTVEGNTSDASGLETNGGGVYFKSYSLASSYLYGYGRLPYVSNSAVTKIDYSGANPTPGLYIANAAKYIYSSEYATSAVTTIPRFSMFEISRVGANNRLFGTFTDVNGNTVTGWVENNSSRIIQISSSGVMSGSWEFDGTGFRYRYTDGSYAAQGWLQDPENMAWYYIGANGYAQSGWLYLSNGTFYLDPNSNAMLTGHRYIDNRWYYFNSDGFLCNGTWEYDGAGYRYRYVDGTYGINCWLDDATNNYARYYLDANGHTVSGWQKIGDAWYYFDPNSGAMLSGWLYIGDKWYYTDQNGAMQTGWVEYEGNYFYLDSSGAKVTGTTMDINGATCTFDENGVLIDGTIIEDTETPVVGNKYESYTQGMAGNGAGTVYAHGIDISKWNNGDDWTTLKLNLAAVKAAGIDFVIMRCGSTNKGKDPMFEMYYNECKRLGLDVGAYFYSYALDAASAVSDAQKCLSYIQGKQFEYPIYMDFEDPTQEGIGSTRSAQICTAFLDTVASGGYLTGMYTYKSWFEQGWVDSSGISSKYEGWVTYPIKSMNHANYDLDFSKKYGMYQYTFEYVIANVGKFDANVCYKDYPTIVKTYGFNNYTATATPNLSASWVQDDYGFRYRYSDGTYAGAGWLLDSSNNAWYYLDANGYAQSGWVNDNGKTYYLDPNSNAMLTGHRYIDGKWYYFDSSGALVTGGMWVQDSIGFKYQMADGSFVYSGWVDEPNSGARYYLDANGYAVSGFQTIDGTLYYFFADSNALFRGGWVTLADGKVYRSASDGAILKGFQYVDGEYFYFDENTGALQTGFVTFGDKWYYFSPEDGTMVTGWFTSPKSGYVYYFNDEGEMATGWAEIDGEWHFFEDDMDKHYGQMLTGWVTSATSGYTYYIAEDGKMVTGWQEIDGNTYYFHPTDEKYLGRMVTGVNEIEGVNYVFDSDGVLVGQLAEPEVDYFTVIYLNADGSFLGYESVESGKAAANIPQNPTMEADAQYTYTFTGWDNDLTSITADTVATAVYDKVINTYSVTFIDMDGNTLDTQTVEYGKSATAPEAPAVDGYTFIGWDTDFESVTENLTVKAEYEKTEQIFYLRGDFNNWDTSDAMTKGENGIYTAEFILTAGTYAYKAANADWSMEWPLGTNQSITLDEKSKVTFTLDTVNHTLTASAESAETKYEVIFMDYDGTVLSIQYVAEGKSAEVPEVAAREGYTFTGWSKEFEYITADVTIVAQYEKTNVAVNNYVVVFVDADGKLISYQIVSEGGSAEAPAAPEKSGYNFIGWDKDYTNVGENLTVKAEYEKTEQIFYLRGDFNSWQTTDVMTEGENGIYTAVLILSAGSYEYKAANADWSMEWPLGTNQTINLSEKSKVTFTLDTVNHTLTATAESAETKYEVIFMDYNGTVLSIQSVAEGKSATAPATPQRAGYTFTGWNNSYNKITADTTLIAQYEKIEVVVNKYMVVFVDDEGKLLSSQLITEGESAEAPEVPKKSGSTFIGWDKDFTSVTENLTVKAQYEKNGSSVTPPEAATTGTLRVEVAGGTGFTISAGSANARPQGTSYMNSKTSIGTTVTVKAATTNGNKFVGWMNDRGLILTTDLSYTFTTTGNDYLKAMYQTDIAEATLVIFKNDKANQILDMQYYVAGDEIVFPEYPQNSAYLATGWSMSAEEIAAKVAAGENVVVTPTWERILVYVNIKVSGGTATGLTDGKALKLSAVTVTAAAAPAGQKFAYWVDHNGNVLSYQTTYKFYPAEDMTVTAVYVAESETIDYDIILNFVMDTTAESADTNPIMISWEVTESANVKFVQAGALLVDSSKYNADTFVKGTADTNVTKWTPGSSNQKPVNTVTANKKGVANGTTWYGMGWITVEIDGVQQTIYTDLLTFEKL